MIRCQRNIRILAGITVNSERNESKHTKNPTSISCNHSKPRKKTSVPGLHHYMLQSKPSKNCKTTNGDRLVWRNWSAELDARCRTMRIKGFWCTLSTQHQESIKGECLGAHQLTSPRYMKHCVIYTLPSLLYTRRWMALEHAPPLDFSPQIIYWWYVNHRWICTKCTHPLTPRT